VFQPGFSSRQIEAFSLLPYFALVYSNSQVDIFEYVGGTAPGFTPAVSFSSSSEAIVRAYSTQAYSYASSDPPLPATPDWVASAPNTSGEPWDVNYSLTIPTAGNYTLYLHGYVHTTLQYASVSIGGPALGQVYFLSEGATLGTPLTMTLPAGPINLELSFVGIGLGYMNPVDYLVLVPGSP